MPLDIYSPIDLYRVMYDERVNVDTSFFLDNFYPGSFFSDQEEIMFSKISDTRKIAPFMLPNESGKPIYRRQGERIQSFKPAYTKPKDALRPGEMLSRQPGELLRTGTATPESRYNAEVVRIAQYQRNAITRLWEWMGARGVLDGKITIVYSREAGAQFPSVTIDFGRDAGQTITLGAGARWGDSGVSIFGLIQTWMDTMSAAAFGGAPNRLTVGAAAYAVMRQDPEIIKLMDVNTRGAADVNMNRGLIRKDVQQPATYVGTLGAGLEVWLYTGTFEANDGSLVPIMDPRDILLTAPGVEGVKAFGAIVDVDAQLQALDIFPKMWKQDDPSATFIMSQSAPLPIPVNPNRTLRARVVA